MKRKGKGLHLHQVQYFMKHDLHYFWSTSSEIKKLCKSPKYFSSAKVLGISSEYLSVEN